MSENYYKHSTLYEIIVYKEKMLRSGVKLNKQIYSYQYCGPPSFLIVTFNSKLLEILRMRTAVIGIFYLNAHHMPCSRQGEGYQ